MKRAIGIMLSVLGLLIVCLGAVIHALQRANIGVIGGADGPTAIFVTTAPGFHAWMLLVPGLLLVLAGTVIFLLRRRVK